MLQRFAADGMPIDQALAKRELGNVKECLAMGFSGDAREALRGERDFWARQCARLMNEGK